MYFTLIIQSIATLHLLERVAMHVHARTSRRRAYTAVYTDRATYMHKARKNTSASGYRKFCACVGLVGRVDGLELWIAVEDDRLVGTRSVRRALAGENLFVTGGAGTGKTETLKRIFRSLRAVHRQQRESAVWLTAMSGPAAWRLGGITLASFVAGRGSCDGGSRR